MSLTSPILDVVVDELQKIKKLADKSIAQLDDEQLWVKLDPEANSVARADAPHGRQHALALDRLPDQRRREARSASRSGIRGRRRDARAS